jgi:effector-binding domain-containing protein
VLTLYYEGEMRERDVDLEVAETVPGSPPAEDPVRVYDLPAVETMACELHHGGFQNVGETHPALLK